MTILMVQVYSGYYKLGDIKLVRVKFVVHRPDHVQKPENIFAQSVDPVAGGHTSPGNHEVPVF